MKTLEQIVGRRKCSISEGFPGTCTNWFGLALTQWTFVGRPIGGRADEKRKKQQFKPLGRGELNWPDIFAAGDEAGIEWYVYEQDSGEGSPFDYAEALQGRQMTTKSSSSASNTNPCWRSSGSSRRYLSVT